MNSVLLAFSFSRFDDIQVSMSEDIRQQATGGRDLVRCGAADVGLQVVSVGMDTDFVFCCNANDIRGEQQRT